jgi:hypothetical protein
MFVYDLAPLSLKLIYAIVLETVRPRRRGRYPKTETRLAAKAESHNNDWAGPYEPRKSADRRGRGE